MKVPVASDEHLIRAAKRDKRRFDALYLEYKDKIFRHIFYKVNQDSACADDLCSITFEKAFTHIESFQWQGISFSAYLFRIANNVIIDYYRAQNKTRNNSELHENIRDNSTSVEDRVMSSDSGYRIEKALMHLDEREQSIIRYKFYEGFTNKKIADMLEISESNVGTILFRAMKKLRKPLSTV